MRATIKPAPGRLIRMHDRAFAPMPDEGVTVEIDGEYQRAINKGDVVIVKPVRPAAPAAVHEPKQPDVVPEVSGDVGVGAYKSFKKGS